MANWVYGSHHRQFSTTCSAMLNQPPGVQPLSLAINEYLAIALAHSAYGYLGFARYAWAPSPSERFSFVCLVCNKQNTPCTIFLLSCVIISMLLDPCNFLILYMLQCVNCIFVKRNFYVLFDQILLEDDEEHNAVHKTYQGNSDEEIKTTTARSTVDNICRSFGVGWWCHV